MAACLEKERKLAKVLLMERVQGQKSVHTALERAYSGSREWDSVSKHRFLFPCAEEVVYLSRETSGWKESGRETRWFDGNTRIYEAGEYATRAERCYCWGLPDFGESMAALQEKYGIRLREFVLKAPAAGDDIPAFGCGDLVESARLRHGSAGQKSMKACYWRLIAVLVSDEQLDAMEKTQQAD